MLSSILPRGKRQLALSWVLHQLSSLQHLALAQPGQVPSVRNKGLSHYSLESRLTTRAVDNDHHNAVVSNNLGHLEASSRIYFFYRLYFYEHFNKGDFFKKSF